MGDNLRKRRAVSLRPVRQYNLLFAFVWFMFLGISHKESFPASYQITNNPPITYHHNSAMHHSISISHVKGFPYDDAYFTPHYIGYAESTEAVFFSGHHHSVVSL